jgi:hypothetical protein
VTPEGHVRIQAAFQRHTENAVSKTVNLAADATRDDVAAVFRRAFELGCKGVTIYRDGSRDRQVLSAGAEAAPRPDGARIRPRARPEVVGGRTIRMETGCGNLYVTTNEMSHGPSFALLKTAVAPRRRPGTGSSRSRCSGVRARWRQPRCAAYPAWNRGHKVLSCADAIGQALETHLDQSPHAGEVAPAGDRAERLAGNCVECGNVLEFEGGCAVCRACGYSPADGVRPTRYRRQVPRGRCRLRRPENRRHESWRQTAGAGRGGGRRWSGAAPRGQRASVTARPPRSVTPDAATAANVVGTREDTLAVTVDQKTTPAHPPSRLRADTAAIEHDARHGRRAWRSRAAAVEPAEG